MDSSQILADGSVVTMRLPREEDAEGMIVYLDEVRRETGFLGVCPEDPLPTLEWERDWLRGLRDGPGVQILTESDGGIVSLCSVRVPELHRLRHRGEIGMSIRAAWWRRGLGTLLMQELVAWGEASSQIEVLTLSVHGDNHPARRLYERSGFHVDGIRPRHVKRGGIYVDEVVMSRWVGGG